MNDLSDLFSTLDQLREYESTHALDNYVPYEFQLKFHNAIGYGTDQPAVQKALVCGNQIGKTKCAANEVALHLTGTYDEHKWYQGVKFKTPIDAVCGTHTIQQTRDVLQANLLGPPGIEDEIGTGTIPKEYIIHTQKSPGYTTAYDYVDVRHKPTGGRSRLFFRPYEIGARKHMGRPLDLSWEDEEPPMDIHMQMVRGGFAKKQTLRLITLTPEYGMTDMVLQILNEPIIGHATVRAGWKDAPHIDFDRKIKEVPEWQIPFRVYGEPTVGEGIVFPIPDHLISTPPIEIPSYWPRIVGIDLGWNHPFACAWLAIDRDTGVTYVYRTFSRSNMKTAEEAAVIKGKEDWIPVIWPHDAAKHDKDSGRTYRDILAAEPYKVNMWPKPFSNPPQAGKPEGTGGMGVEVGLKSMLDSFFDGTLKIFSTCKDFFDEKKLYHRRLDAQGKWMLVPKNDDVISAVRYAFMMQRHARTKPKLKKKNKQFKGVVGW